MRTVTSLHASWFYTPAFEDSFAALREAPADWTEIAIPHANRELPLNGFDETDYQFVSTYFRSVEIPEGERFFLDFDGVMCACDVWIDGRHAGAHRGGYTPFSVEITGLVTAGKKAAVVVRADSTERKDTPPFGFVVDYLTFGGIYREVRLRAQGANFISSVFAKPGKIFEEKKSLDIDVLIDRGAASSGTKATRVTCELIDGARTVAIAAAEIPDTETEATILMDGIEGIELWDTENPKLYAVRIRLGKGTAPAMDECEHRVGFRSARFTPDGFFLNGKRLKLVGLNRHQAWPYIGYAMPRRAQRRDAEILKNELGANIVRTSHYPQSAHFLDACDELGLLVFEEMPGWRNIGGDDWQDAACLAITEMIERDRNRPSVILWGVRVNESVDHHDFYSRTNALARNLDPTRQTGGVRDFAKSEFLEDVYTFNDFTYSGEADGYVPLKKPAAVAGKRAPYLVSEFNGHMFPTKRYDCEERLAEHALRHARVLDAAYADDSVSGAIGWCAFDYNTHKDFGSGDRVCYHGVMDMFREPKYAAAVYASQMDPSRRVVLEAASIFSKGDRCAARLLPVEIWTNCDSVVLWREGKRVGEFFPDRKNYPNLPHPPVVIDDLIGEQIEAEGFSARDNALIRKISGIVFMKNIDAVGIGDKLRVLSFLVRNRVSFRGLYDIIAKYTIGWGRENESFRIEGIVGGKAVAERTYGGDARAERLEVRPDNAEIDADPWDTTRVAVRAVDGHGNVNPYVAEAVSVAVEGPAEIIGPKLIPLTGGSAAFWIRTTGKAGTARIIVSGGRFGESRAEVAITGR